MRISGIFSALVRMWSLRACSRALRTPGWTTLNSDPTSLLLASLLIFKMDQAKWLYLCYISLFLHL